MYVSYPELYTLSKKILETCRLPDGVVEEGAEVVAWSEMSGHFGLRQLKNELDSLQGANVSSIHLLSQDSRFALIDGNCLSSLICGRIAADLASVKAQETGFGAVSVKNCKGKDFLIENAVHSARRGMFCAINWVSDNERQITNNWAIVYPGQSYPLIIKEDLSKDFNHNGKTDGFVVLCSNNDYGLRFLTPDLDIALEGNKVQRPEAIKSLWDQANKEGHPMDQDLWQELTQIASQVLVESSATSRLKGTGAEAD